MNSILKRILYGSQKEPKAGVAGSEAAASSSPATPPVAAAAPGVSAPTAGLHFIASDEEDDQDDFLKYLKQANRAFRKPGLPIKEEYANWRAHRAKTRPACLPGRAEA